jgi:hypothetical protein
MAYNYSSGFINATISGIATTLNNGVIEIYTGSRPTTADAPVKGTLLGIITSGGLPFTAGSPTNGLQFSVDTEIGTIEKSADQTWQFKALESGAAGWLRIKANAADTGANSITAIRIDGTIATYGGDATIEGSANIEKDKIYTINKCSINWAKG